MYFHVIPPQQPLTWYKYLPYYWKIHILHGGSFYAPYLGSVHANNSYWIVQTSFYDQYKVKAKINHYQCSFSESSSRKEQKSYLHCYQSYTLPTDYKSQLREALFKNHYQPHQDTVPNSLSQQSALLIQLKCLFLHHDDVIKWKHFPCHWPFARKSPVTGEFLTQKVSDAELWYFFCSAPEYTVD